MSNRFRLVGLRLAAYRGARERISVPLDEPLNVIFGANGSGKSTIATAIEWALFPVESAKLKETGIDERRGWRVRNVHSKAYPEVVLRLEKDGVTLEIRQAGLKGTSKRPPAIECGYADFKHLSYVHQETLRDFLVGQPGPRQEAFGRLLGAGWAQDLTRALDKARRELKCDEADQRVNHLEQLLAAKMAEVKRLAAQERQHALGEGLQEPWAAAGGAVASSVADRMAALCRRASIEAPAAPDAIPFEDYSARLAAVVRWLRQRGPAERHGELAARRARLEAARASYLETVTLWRRRGREVAEFEKSRGAAAELAARREELAERRKSIERQLAAISRQRSVLHQAVEYYKYTPEARICPVCERKVSETFASELEHRLGAGITEAEKTLRVELDEVVSRVDELAGHLAELERLMAGAMAARERLSRERRFLEETLGYAVAEDEDPAAVSAIEIEKAEAELRKLRETVEAWMEELSQIEAEGRKMETVSRLLELETRMETLGDLRRTPEWKLMVERRRFLSRQEQNLRLLMETTRGLATAIAENNLKRVTGPISGIFRDLTKRSDFPSVLVDPAKKYEVSLAGGDTTLAPTAILNLTDLNALAIGVIAGMATAFEEATDLGFLILDDPSQGMDETVTRRLGDVLSRLSAQIQVVVATPDPVLAAVLQRSPRRKNIIRLSPRDPDSRQPSVRIESVSH